MHSTIQTGLYTPNIYNYEHNYHHPNHHHQQQQHQSALSNSCHHFPPPIHGHHKHKPTNQLHATKPSKEQMRGSLTQLNQIKTNNALSSKSSFNSNKTNSKLNTNSSNKKDGGIQSMNASLFAINCQDSKQRYEKLLVSGGGSTLNILNSKTSHLFSSNYNLNQTNTNENSLKNSNSISNLSNSNRTNSFSNINLKNDDLNLKVKDGIKDENHNGYTTVKFAADYHHPPAPNNNLNTSNNKIKNNQCSNEHNCKKNRLQKFKSFWECTKPCGILTCLFGVFLVILSALGFFFLFDKNLCSKMNICSNGLLQIGSVSNLVIGVVLAMIGVVIIVYSKKNTQVIIATGKHFENLSLVVENNKGNLVNQINADINQNVFISSINKNTSNPTITTATTSITPTTSNNKQNNNNDVSYNSNEKAATAIVSKI